MSRLRRAGRRAGGNGRWRWALLGLAVLAGSVTVARLACPALPLWSLAAVLAAGLPALLVPWRWLGTLAVLAVTAIQCAAAVLAGDRATPWLGACAAAVLAAVLAVEPLERPGDEPPEQVLAVQRWPLRIGLPVAALAAGAGVGWAAAAQARPSAPLVVGGLAAGLLAVVLVVREHR